MRASAHIHSLWNAGGPFIGAAGKPNGVVTVETGWSLHTQGGGAGTWRKYPIRWYKSAVAGIGGSDGPVVETRIPNIKTIQIDRSVDTDAATAVITMYNQKMNLNGVAGGDVLGDPGYYNPNRGGATALARWGQTATDWTGVLDVCSLIRVYQGYGTYGASFSNWQQDVLNDFIVPTFTGIVDKVDVGTDGLLTMRCRDMFALLIDQEVYPPLIPGSLYPRCLRYCRTAAAVNPLGVPGTSRNTIYQQLGASQASSTDVRASSFNAPVFGHYPADAIDDNLYTFWLSYGYTEGTHVEWLETVCRQPVDTVILTPFAGPYTVYISVMENGTWQGTSTVPAEAAYTGADTSAIPYVSTGTLVADTANTFTLPRNYTAQKVRISITGLVQTTIGPPYFRGGIRTIQLIDDGTPAQGAYNPATAAFDDGSDYHDYCVDEDTEALTKRGWLGQAEIREGDEVLGIDSETGKSQWHRVNSVYRQYRKRSMVRMKGASFDALTTPDHRWLVRNGGVASTQYGRRDREGSRLKWTTSDAMNTNDSILLSVPPVCSETTTYSDEFVEFVAWFWTEGNWNASGLNLSQSQVKNPKCVARIDTCLTTLFGEADQRGPGRPSRAVESQARWSRYVRPGGGMILYNISKTAAEPMRSICDSVSKAVSIDFLLALTRFQLDLFIAVSMLADASCNKERRGNMLRNTTKSEKTEIMTQNNEERIKSFEFACVLAGQPIVTHLRHTKEKGKRISIWATTLLKTPETNIVRAATAGGKATLTREDYEGIVWCPQTELGTWVCRRTADRGTKGGLKEGKIYSTYLTGNSDIIKEFLLYSGFFLHRVQLGAPMVGMAATPNGNGYWLAASDGGVFAFDVPFYGSAANLPLNKPIVGIASTPNSTGYWLVGGDGGVFAYGSAGSYGSAANLTLNAPIVGMASTLSGAGYWLVGADGGIFAYGNATNYGGLAGTTLNAPIVGMAATVSGNGYWLVGADGGVYAFGDAVFRGSAASLTLNRPMSGMIASTDGNGYWLFAQDGGVFAYNTPFTGSAGSTFTAAAVVGGARTSAGTGYWLVDSSGKVFTFGAATTHGFISAYAPSEQPSVYGNIEATGAYAAECITEDQFDKKTVMQVITMLKEIVAYVTYADEEGAAHFESSNIWTQGNLYPSGAHTNIIPEVDERKQLTDYKITKSGENLRSQITIASNDPNAGFTDTVTTTYVPPYANLLRGIVKPAEWTNGFFQDLAQQKIMAELISLQIFFSLRQGSVTCAANPAISINDQVKIFERTTGETNIHYVRGSSTTMDLDSGDFTQQLTTHWLGDNTFWAIDDTGTLRTALIDQYVTNAARPPDTKYTGIVAPRAILASPFGAAAAASAPALLETQADNPLTAESGQGLQL